MPRLDRVFHLASSQVPSTLRGSTAVARRTARMLRALPRRSSRRAFGRYRHKWLRPLYTVRSERMFCEQLNYNLLYRWFLDMNWDEPGFDHSSFTRNRERLLAHDVAGEFFRTVGEQARA